MTLLFSFSFSLTKDVTQKRFRGPTWKKYEKRNKNKKKRKKERKERKKESRKERKEERKKENFVPSPSRVILETVTVLVWLLTVCSHPLRKTASLAC